MGSCPAGIRHNTTIGESVNDVTRGGKNPSPGFYRQTGKYCGQASISFTKSGLISRSESQPETGFASEGTESVCFSDVSCGFSRVSEVRPEGLEPPTIGSEDRGGGTASPEKSSTYKAQQGPLTPQWTPGSPKSGRTCPVPLPSGVAEIVAVWPKLPEHIKAAIMALVQTHGGRKTGVQQE